MHPCVLVSLPPRDLEATTAGTFTQHFLFWKGRPRVSEVFAADSRLSRSGKDLHGASAARHPKWWRNSRPHSHTDQPLGNAWFQERYVRAASGSRRDRTSSSLAASATSPFPEPHWGRICASEMPLERTIRAAYLTFAIARAERLG